MRKSVACPPLLEALLIITPDAETDLFCRGCFSIDLSRAAVPAT